LTIRFDIACRVEEGACITKQDEDFSDGWRAISDRRDRREADAPERVGAARRTDRQAPLDGVDDLAWTKWIVLWTPEFKSYKCRSDTLVKRLAQPCCANPLEEKS